MKWPHLAPHSRASLADALATVTAALTKPRARRPAARAIRAALYGHAFSPRHSADLDSAAARALAWLQRASLPVAQVSDPRVIRAALDALTLRLDGGRAAATTIARKRAVLHGALGYAVELGLLPSNPSRRSTDAGPGRQEPRTAPARERQSDGTPTLLAIPISHRRASLAGSSPSPDTGPAPGHSGD